MNFFKKILSFLWAHKVWTSIGIVVLLILIFIFRPKPAPLISTQKVTYTDLAQIVSVSGAIAAKNTANLTFPVSGTISWIGVKTGDNVTAGQVIATLDSRTALKNLQQSLIAYSLQRNTFDQTIANNGNTQNPNDAVNDVEKRILQNNQYNLDQAVNSVELSDLARQQSVLSTPIAGIVTKADAPVAGVTEVMGTTSFVITDPASVVFNMDVDEADIGKVAVGQRVSLVLDAYPNDTLSLPVDSIDFVSHTTANGGNAYTVAVKLGSNLDYKYRVGMNGNADITTAKKYHVLTIPLSSITGNNQVYVKSGRTFILRKVTLGLQSDTDAEVTSGLSDGDIIAIDPTQVTKK